MSTIAALRDSCSWWSKRIASLPAKTIWNISKLSVVERNILYPRYQRYIKQHQNQLSTLSLTEQRRRSSKKLDKQVFMSRP